MAADDLLAMANCDQCVQNCPGKLVSFWGRFSRCVLKSCSIAGLGAVLYCDVVIDFFWRGSFPGCWVSLHLCGVVITSIVWIIWLLALDDFELSEGEYF